MVGWEQTAHSDLGSC